MKYKKVVIITGAAGGIGLALAKKFAENNFCIVLVDIKRDELENAAVVLEAQYKADCLVCNGSLENIGYTKEIVAKAMETWGRVDVVINNAAWRTLETMRTISLENWEKVVRINLTAPAFLSKYAAAAMEVNKTKGVIINISSVMSQRAGGYSPAYIACKGGIESLTYELAVLYGPKSIRVIGVSPGSVETSLARDYKDDDGNNISDKLRGRMDENIPLQRTCEPAEIANVCYWLSSDEASYITGTCITVDGGFQRNFNSYNTKRLQYPKEF